MRKFLALFASLLLLSTIAEARVFDFKNESFAAYFGGTLGPSNVRDSVYGQSSGTATTFESRGVESNASGEFGLAFAFNSFSLRLGVDYFVPKFQKGTEGRNSAGTLLMQLDSQVTAWVPMANIEIYIKRWPKSRVALGLGYGYAFINIDNLYTLTAAGNAQYPGIGDLHETGSGQAHIAQGYLGYEFLFTDTVTATFLAGYRYSPQTILKSARTGPSLSGAQTEKENLKMNDGTDRTVNLSGGYAGLTFRFYFAN